MLQGKIIKATGEDNGKLLRLKYLRGIPNIDLGLDGREVHSSEDVC